MKRSSKLLCFLLAVIMLVGVSPLALAAGNVTVRTNFVYSDGTIAEHPVVDANILSGSDYNFTSASISVTGYIPTLGSYNTSFGTIRIVNDKLVYNLRNITSNVEVTVTYIPKATTYTVLHYKQDVDGSGYTLAETEILTVNPGETPSITSKNYPGFTQLSITPLPASADGTTRVNVYYNRNNYKVTFNLDGGYNVDTVYDRFGRLLGDVGTPIKTGYDFAGWLDESNNPATLPETIPDHNVTYKASWTPKTTANYTVVYYRQNADDDGYTYFTSENKSGAVGTNPGAVSNFGNKSFSGVTDAGQTNTYFHYNGSKTIEGNRGVNIAADGTTVYAVYYDRNVYTIRFNVGEPGTSTYVPQQTIHHDAEYLHHDAVVVHHDAVVTHHPAVTEHHDAYLIDNTLGTVTAKITNFGAAWSSGNKNTTNVLTSTKTSGTYKGAKWTPLFKSGDTSANLTWNNINLDSVGVKIRDETYNNWPYYSNYPGEKKSSHIAHVALYNNDTVTIPNPDSNLDIDMNTGVITFKSSATLTLTTGSTDTNINTIVPVTKHVTFVDTYHSSAAPALNVDQDYTGYATKKYVTNLTSSNYVPAGDTVITEAWDEIITPAWDETITEAYDELVKAAYDETIPAHYVNDPGWYYTVTGGSTLQEVTEGTTDARVFVVDGEGVTHDYYTTYSFQARYGQSLYGLWPRMAPTNSDGTINTDALEPNVAYVEPKVNNITYKAITKGTSEQWNTVQGTLADHVLLNTANGSTSTYYVCYQNALVKADLYYIDQDAPYSSNVIEHQVVNFTDNNYSLNARTFIGYDYDWQDRDGFTLFRFYYYRHTYTVNYYSENVNVANKGAQYKRTLDAATYNITPTYPSTLPAGAFVFEGWYDAPEYTEEHRFQFGEETMPGNNMALFAHWVETDLSVTVLNERNGATLDVQGVEYMETVHEPSTLPSKTGYTFIGWYYRDSNDIERPFEFETTAITHSLTVYAKWRSNVAKSYTVRYQVEGSSPAEYVAEPMTGTTMEDITLYPKVGAELHEDYRTGYFPINDSYTLEIDNDENRTYTFYYRPQTYVPYTVKYMKEGTTQEIHAQNYVENNVYAVIDLMPVGIEGYEPTVASKRLIVNVGDTSKNVVTFYYKEAENPKAPVTVTHYIRDGQADWTVLSASSELGTVGQTYSANALDLSTLGYTFMESQINSADKTTDTSLSDTLTIDGLALKFYYNSNALFYVVHSSDPDLEEIPYEVNDYPTGFDITAEVAEGYLYGGLSLDDWFDWPINEDDEGNPLCGKKIMPLKNAVYYLREVSDDYLQPRMLSAKSGGTVSRYLLTAVDAEGMNTSADNFYVSYGFLLDSDTSATKLSDYEYTVNDAITIDNKTETTLGTSKKCYPLFNSIIIRNSKGDTEYHAGGNTNPVIFSKASYPAISGDDYIGCATLGNQSGYPGKTVDSVAYNFHFVPYYVTYDGVMVTGTTERYVKAAADSTSVTNKDVTISSITRDATASISTTSSAPVPVMMAVSNYALGETITELPADSGTKTAKVTVAAVVGKTSKAYSGAAGDFTGLVEIPSVKGYRFAGWFEDSELTVPADLSNVQADTRVYAKLIVDTYFAIAYFATESKNTVSALSFTTAVDHEANYAEIGMEINVDGETQQYPATIYSATANSKKPRAIFGETVDESAMLVTKSVSTKGMTDGTVITARAYYTTLDGSVVYGTPVTLVYHAGGVEEM